MWLARLTELGLLRPSFVPPAAIRDLRDYPGPHPADPGAGPLLPAAGKAARALSQHWPVRRTDRVTSQSSARAA